MLMKLSNGFFDVLIMMLDWFMLMFFNWVFVECEDWMEVKIFESFQKMGKIMWSSVEKVFEDYVEFVSCRFYEDFECVKLFS